MMHFIRHIPLHWNLFPPICRKLWGIKHFNLCGTSVLSTIVAIPFTVYLAMILTVIPAIPNERNDVTIPTTIPTPTPKMKKRSKRYQLAAHRQSDRHTDTETYRKMKLTSLCVHVCCKVIVT